MRSLADVTEVEAGEFKSSVIAAARVSYQFTWRRVLRAANEHPWSLARGEIEGNLTELVNSDRPWELTASRCWLLMQVGLSLRQSVETVQPLQDCNRTSTIPEQQHDSLHALKKEHTPSTMKIRWSLVRRRRRMNNCLRGH